jgi:transposase
MAGRVEDSVWSERQDLIRKQEESGLSVAQFCRDNGLHVGNFHAWRLRFAKRRDRSQRGSGQLAGDRRPQQAFVQLPMPLVSTAATVPSNAAVGSSWVELSIADGMVVRVPATDMRKSFDGLCGIVKGDFEKDILEGDYFVFFNRLRDRCKILLWDRDGLILIYKRLEQGCFQRAPYDGDGLAIEVDATTLTLILTGIDLSTAKRRKRFAVAKPVSSAS